MKSLDDALEGLIESLTMWFRESAEVSVQGRDDISVSFRRCAHNNPKRDFVQIMKDEILQFYYEHEGDLRSKDSAPEGNVKTNNSP